MRYRVEAAATRGGAATTIGLVAQLPSRRLPVVAGLAYHERVDRLPSQFTATLQAEAGNRFNRRAVAVLVNGEKVGYLPPELSPHYWRTPAMAR